MRLFREKGFEATTADEIAAAAGLSRATFFNHFGNKSAVLRVFGEELEAKVSGLLAAREPSASPLGDLKRVLLAMATAAEDQREDLKIVFVHSLQDGTYFSTPTPARIKVHQHLAGLIGKAQTVGEVRADLSAPALATQIGALYNNAIVAILFGGQKAATAIARLWEFALGGLTAPACGAAGRSTGKATR